MYVRVLGQMHSMFPHLLHSKPTTFPLPTQSPTSPPVLLKISAFHPLPAPTDPRTPHPATCTTHHLSHQPNLPPATFSTVYQFQNGGVNVAKALGREGRTRRGALSHTCTRTYEHVCVGVHVRGSRYSAEVTNLLVSNGPKTRGGGERERVWGCWLQNVKRKTRGAWW